MKIFKNLILLSTLTAICISSADAKDDILSLSMEELSDISVDDTPATLTTTALKNIPATITTITQDDILESGARNLDELLEIYVPSFNYMKNIRGSQMGFRGIISDRNNKILLLLNGRVMNIKAKDGGAVTERWFSTLGDIKSIKVITGPGSAIYGAGAIAGVINIETFSGKSNDGVYISAKTGSNEDFLNAEISYGTKLSDELSMYLYYGVDKYNGAPSNEAPLKFAFDYSRGNYIDAPADKEYKFGTSNDNSSLEKELRHKLHFQLDSKNFTFWTRFTRSSLSTATEQQLYYVMSNKNSGQFEDTGTRNQQITAFAQYRQKVSKDFKLTYDLSYMRSDIYTNFFNKDTKASDKFWGEDNLMGKLLAQYNFTQNHKLALGTEYNYNWFGRPSDISDESYSQFSPTQKNLKFETNLLSFFGEYQAKFTDSFTMFLGGRADKHKYSPWMYSPRLDFIYNSSGKDVFKLGFNRSVRNSDDVDLYDYYNKNDEYTDVEEINTAEFIYARYMQNSNIHLSVFYNDHDIVAYNSDTRKTQNIGTATSYGAEIEFEYKQNSHEFYISHSYTKLSDFKLKDDSTSKQNISAKPYGYGDDFANWHNHITKLRYNYKISKKLKWVNSLRIFWGMDGAKDMANYNNDNTQNTTNITKYRMSLYDSGHTTAFEESVYLNTALIWNIDKQTVVTLNGYNLLGLIDEDYNKRNFFNTTSQYRDAAPSVALGLKYKF